jgi:sugar phosphate permease
MEAKEEDVEEVKLRPPEGVAFQCWRMLTFIVCCIAYMVVYFQRICPSIVAEDMSKAYGVPKTSLSIFSSIYFYPYGVLQPFAGLLADLVPDPCILVGISQICAAVGAFICGASKNLMVGTVGRFLVGLGCCPTYVPICKMITSWFPLKWYSEMLGVLSAVGLTGGAIAQAPLAAYARSAGWRWPFYTVGIVGVVIGLFCLFLLKGHPRGFGFAPVNEESPVIKTTIKEKCRSLWENFKLVISKLVFWLVSMFCFFTSGPGFAMSGLWLAPFLQHVFGYTLQESGNISLSTTIGALIGSIALPAISRLSGTRKWTLVGSSAVLLSVCLCFAFVGFSKINLAALIVMLGLFGMTTNSTIVVGFAILREKYPVSAAGAVIGCANCIALLSSAVFQQVSSEIIKKEGTVGDSDIYTDKAYQFGIWVLFAAAAGLSIACMAVVSDRGSASEGAVGGEEEEDGVGVVVSQDSDENGENEPDEI